MPQSLPHACQGHCVWLTPQHLIDQVIAVLGQIDLDPCSNSKTAPHVTARKVYTAQDDGLAQPWTGTVFLNPPWSRKEGITIIPWIEKLTASFTCGEVTEAILLIPAWTEMAWFQDNLFCYYFCALRGRLKFSHGIKRAPFASLAVYLGPNLRRFTRIFSQLGIIYRPARQRPLSLQRRL